jgi:hypothetical protein
MKIMPNFSWGLRLAASPLPPPPLVATMIQTVSLNSISLSIYNPDALDSFDILNGTAQIYLNLLIKIRRL